MANLWTITVVIIVISLLSTGCIPSMPTDLQHPSQEMGQLSQQLESIALELSSLLADTENRSLLSAQTETTKTNAVVLSEILAEYARQDALSESSEGDDRIFRLASSVHQAETMMEESGMPIPRLDLILPEEAHAELLLNSDDVYVAVDPLLDENEVESITAYSRGEPITLSADEPPSIPTFVITPAESESLDRDYPLTILEEPLSIEENESIVDDFVGILQILIIHDHEPWYRGSPEIYIHYRRWLTATGVWKDTSHDLGNVNDENKWYSLGDPNNTYIYLHSGYDKSLEIIVYESDGPADDDDVVGVFIPNWKALPFDGYTEGTALGTTKDAQIYLDRD